MYCPFNMIMELEFEVIPYKRGLFKKLLALVKFN